MSPEATGAETRPTRLVLFEVGAGAYAIPIADVLEIIEGGPEAGIPTLPRAVARVVNHHGDALPLVAREAIFDDVGAELPEPTHVLVMAGRSGEAGCLALPVDRVLGLADLVLGRPTPNGLVTERTPVDGRVVAVLDAGRLLERAARTIGEASGSSVPIR